ncbi:MAG: hypothetical protein LBG19_07025 [Prevotellaceae bacterium]|jgi:hypothetical protein|nr:hypothetical protein [Prevotellaceae bacterium]
MKSGTENITDTKTKEEKGELRKNTCAEFATMTNDEYSSLVEKFGIFKVDKMVEILNNYKGSNGKTTV